MKVFALDQNIEAVDYRQITRCAMWRCNSFMYNQFYKLIISSVPLVIPYDLIVWYVEFELCFEVREVVEKDIRIFVSVDFTDCSVSELLDGVQRSFESVVLIEQGYVKSSCKIKMPIGVYYIIKMLYKDILKYNYRINFSVEDNLYPVRLCVIGYIQGFVSKDCNLDFEINN